MSEESSSAARIEALRSRSGEFDFGACFSGAYDLYKNNFGAIFGAGLLVLALSLLLAVPREIGAFLIHGGIFHPEGTHMAMVVFGSLLTLFGLVIQAVVGGPLYGGFFKYLLMTKRGQDPQFGVVFSGFGAPFVQLMLTSIIGLVLAGLGLLLCLLPGIYLATAYLFAIILTIDKRLGYWDALETSRQVVTKNWFLFFAFFLVAAIVAMSGTIACCIGVLVTAPFVSCAMVVLYEQIFGEAPATPELEAGA